MGTILKISDSINKNIASLHSDGLKFYSQLIEALGKQRIVIDFNGIDRITTAFINASLGKLMEDFKDPKEILSKMEFEGFENEYIEEKVKRRIEQLSNKELLNAYNDSILEEFEA